MKLPCVVRWNCVVLSWCACMLFSDTKYKSKAKWLLNKWICTKFWQLETLHIRDCSVHWQRHPPSPWGWHFCMTTIRIYVQSDGRCLFLLIAVGNTVYSSWSVRHCKVLSLTTFLFVFFLKHMHLLCNAVGMKSWWWNWVIIIPRWS